MKTRFVIVLSAIIAMVFVMHTPSVRAECVVGTLDTPPGLITEEEFWYSQSQMGNAVADAMCASTGAQISLLNNGDLVGSLGQGDITEQDISSMFTDDRMLAVAEISAGELFELLEHSVSQVTVDSDTERLIKDDSVFEGFCQVSGLTYTYDVSAPVGQRIVQVTLSDGRKPAKEDSEYSLTVCATEYMLSGGYGFPACDYKITEETLITSLTEYVSVNREFPNITEDRICVIGCRDTRIGGNVSRQVIFVAAVAIIILAFFGTNRLKKYRAFVKEDAQLNPYDRYN